MVDAAIVGWAHTPFGKLEEDVEGLVGRVAGAAIEDAGLDPSEIDGVFLGMFNNGFSKQDFQAALVALGDERLAHTPATRVENACATGSAALYAALDFIEAGRGRVALVVGAEKMTGVPTAQAGDVLLGASYRREEAEVDGGFVVRGARPERWILQTDFNNDEAVGYLADRLARLGVEAHLAAHGAQPGAPVTIGNVTFDWEPTTLAGVDIVPTGRGTDLRIDQVDRVGAAERKAMHRLRRGLDVDGHTLDEDD